MPGPATAPASGPPGPASGSVAPVTPCAPDGPLGPETVDAAVLTDRSLAKGVPVHIGTGDDTSCIALTYAKPTEMSSLVLAIPISGDFFHSPLALPTLEASDDGKEFRKIADVPSGSIVQHTISFAPVTAPANSTKV